MFLPTPPLPGLVRLYRFTLVLYPRAYRREYAPLMVQIFNDRYRETRREFGAFGLVSLCLETLADLLKTAVIEHFDRKGANLMKNAPAKISRYEVLAQLHDSGFGNVHFRAHDPQHARDVVIEYVDFNAPSKIDEATWRKIMKRQALLLGQLDHPGIPKCYDHAIEEERVYVVKEFIHGQTLREIMEETDGFLPAQTVVGWAIRICDLLRYLHNREPPLIYMDMKPKNVMLDKNGEIYLVDFGVTEEYYPGRELSRIGTEGYAPPEQYWGEQDARSDLYALGATLHHLLTRRDPRDFKPFTFHEAMPRTLNPAISELLETVIMKALAREPGDRYQTAEEMKTALLAC